VPAHVAVHVPVKVSVIVPTLNEAANLPYVFARLPDGLHEVVLVDGGSTDGTVEMARSLRPDVTVVRQSRRGKGNAMAHGFEAATGDILVMLDADGSAAPEEIPAYVTALLLGADFAKGSRYLASGGSVDLTWLRNAGNKFLNRTVNSLFKTRYTDLCYGYNAFWAHCLPHLGLNEVLNGSTTQVWGDGFEIETLINVRVAVAGLKVMEVPSTEAARIHGVSKLNAWRDGIRVLRTALRERRRARQQARNQAKNTVVATPALPAGTERPQPATAGSRHLRRMPSPHPRGRPASAAEPLLDIEAS
jgi:glycosyltransferase involved in cell wall biosynthesis